MTPSAQHAQIDFARFASEAAGSLYFDQLLRDGYAAWPTSFRNRYPGLRSWRCLSGLEHRIRALTSADSRSPVLLANRSAELMRLTARLMFAECKTVLTTDLSWPSYQRILQIEARRARAQLWCLRLRRKILCDRISAKEVACQIAATVARFGCDGLFLPIVDNLGVRLPIEDIATRLRRPSKIRFLAVDGAQALAHVPVSINAIGCDVFLAGCHKWVRAYNPLGIAVLGNPSTRMELRADARRAIATRVIDDPLMRMTTELEVGSLSRYGETVNLLPLFTGAGALQDLPIDHGDMTRKLDLQRRNEERLRSMLDTDRWRFVEPVDQMQSGVCLLAGRTEDLTQVTPDELRRAFHGANVAVTTYPQAHVRLSMPVAPWTDEQVAVLLNAFRGQPAAIA